MNNILPFKKKEITGIVNHGTVTVNEDGSVLIKNFQFNNVSYFDAIELARAWAIKRLRDA